MGAGGPGVSFVRLWREVSHLRLLLQWAASWPLSHARVDHSGGTVERSLRLDLPVVGAHRPGTSEAGREQARGKSHM